MNRAIRVRFNGQVLLAVVPHLDDGLIIEVDGEEVLGLIVGPDRSISVGEWTADGEWKELRKV